MAVNEPWRYDAPGDKFGPRFRPPLEVLWSESTMTEVTDWLTDNFGQRGWYRDEWTIHATDPTVATAFRIRWC